MLSKENMETIYSITNTFLFQFLVVFTIFIGMLYVLVWTGASMVIFEPYLFFMVAFMIFYYILEKKHTSVLFEKIE
jgi:hypothetical protein